MKVSRFSTILLILLVLISFGILLALPVVPAGLLGLGSLADLLGFLALALIAATGVMMLFKKKLASLMGNSERVWRLHILIAGAAGLFLGLHIVLFFAFPLSLPILFGYAATGAALFVWLTGGIYFQGIRNSMFYHGVFSIVGIFLMVVHTFGAGRNIPMELSGISLAATAILVIVGVAVKLTQSWKSASA